MADLANIEPGAPPTVAGEPSSSQDATIQNLQVAPQAVGTTSDPRDMDTTSDQPKNTASPHDQSTGKSEPMDVDTDGHIDHDHGDSPAPESRDQRDVLSDLCSEQSLDILETSAKVGMVLLQDLREHITGVGTETGQHYLTSIEKLLQSAEKTRSIVGVVGNTGAGKSSVINAVLDEER